jgi:hypothetical protein
LVVEVRKIVRVVNQAGVVRANELRGHVGHRSGDSGSVNFFCVNPTTPLYRSRMHHKRSGTTRQLPENRLRPVKRKLLLVIEEVEFSLSSLPVVDRGTLATLCDAPVDGQVPSFAKCLKANPRV